MSTGDYAEVHARDLQPGHEVQLWSESSRAFIFLRVVQVEHIRPPRKERVQVRYEDIPGVRQYVPGERFVVTAESFRAVREWAGAPDDGCVSTRAHGLRPGYEVRVWDERTQAYVPARITRVELSPAAAGQDRILVWREGAPGCVALHPETPVRVTAGSFEQVQAEREKLPPVRLYVACRWGRHLLHRDEGAPGWKDDSGSRVCPVRPYGGRSTAHEAAPLWREPVPPARPVFGLAAGANSPPGASLERALVGDMRRALATLRSLASLRAGRSAWLAAEEDVYVTLSTALDASYREGVKDGYRNGQQAEAARRGTEPAPPREIPLTPEQEETVRGIPVGEILGSGVAQRESTPLPRQDGTTAMHSHGGYALHSHAVRADHKGVPQADGRPPWEQK